MTDSKNVILVTLFIGFISFFTLLGAGNYIDITGTSQINNLQAPEVEQLNIEKDIFIKKNVTVVDTQKYFNGSQDYNTSKAIVLAGNKTSGYVSYNIPGAEIIDTKAQKESPFIDSRTHLWRGNISGECGNKPLDVCTPLRAESSTQVNDTDFITIEFDEDKGILTGQEPVLYEIKSVKGKRSGFIDNLRTLINSFILDTSTKWVLYLIVLPLTAFAIFLLIRYAGSYIPFT